MKINCILTCLIISSLIYSCQARNTPKNINTDSTSKNLNNDSTSKPSLTGKDCLIANESCIFQKDYFPFGFENYNTIKLKAFFDKSITIDSVETNDGGFISRIYKFSNKASYISFFVKINDSEPYFT